MSDLSDVFRFGTSCSLQAHANLLFFEAKVPVPVTVVQLLDNPSRGTGLATLAGPGGYPARIRCAERQYAARGMAVASVMLALSTTTNLEGLSGIVTEEAVAILSNTGGKGTCCNPPT
ncbi:hypothetical protein [Falsirhodobacter sp. 1013]|uniref:hypothetical protein n=1 Tax=Falsirhodobacter sp. 1013 TaxID=3417566 RepID=UPI003EB97A12